MPTPSWEPEPALVDRARRGGIAPHTLNPVDKAWLVATLTLEGTGAEEIAHLLGCSERLVRKMRGEPAVTLAEWALHAHKQVHRLAQEAARAIRDRETLQRAYDAETTRLKSQRAELIDQLHRARHRACPHCGHTAA